MRAADEAPAGSPSAAERHPLLTQLRGLAASPVPGAAGDPASPRKRLRANALLREAAAAGGAVELSVRGSSSPRCSAAASAATLRPRGGSGCFAARPRAFATLAALAALVAIFVLMPSGRPVCPAAPAAMPAAFTALAVAPCTAVQQPRHPPGTLRLNELTGAGTHNSYHQSPLLPVARAFAYTHPSLVEQLERGATSLELDVHWHRGSWSVFHQPLVDQRSSCGCLAACLEEVARWRAAHPHHAPLTLILEPKFNLDWPRPPPCAGGRPDALLALQREIAAAFPAGALLTPAVLQGGASSLKAALAPGSCGWPSVAEARGSVLVVLNLWRENADCVAAARAIPVQARLMFTRSSASAPAAVEQDAAVVEPGDDGATGCGCGGAMDAARCGAALGALVREGLLVRAATRLAKCGGGGGTAASDRAAVLIDAGVQMRATDDLAADMREQPCGAGRPACCGGALQLRAGGGQPRPLECDALQKRQQLE